MRFCSHSFIEQILKVGAVIAAISIFCGLSANAALTLKNGGFESPDIGGVFSDGTAGEDWFVKNLDDPYNLMLIGDPTGEKSGNMATGSQFAIASRWSDQVSVFAGGVGNSPSGMYIEQSLGTLDAADLHNKFTLSADLIHDIEQFNPVFAGAGFTMGFFIDDGVTRKILAQQDVSYAADLPDSDVTPLKIPGQLVWDVSQSGLAAGTTINAFIGFRLDVSSSSYDLNAVAIDNVELNLFSRLVWTGADASVPTEWSTAAGVLNWRDYSGNAAKPYLEGSNLQFDDSAGSSTTVDISAANVFPGSVVFSISKDYILQGTKGIAGFTGLEKNGSGILTINNVNTYSGDTAINAGTVVIGEAGALPSATRLIMPGGHDGAGTLDLNGHNQTVSSLSGGAGAESARIINSSNANAVLTVETTTGINDVFNGNVSNDPAKGSLGLTKNGGGTLTIVGVSDYTGDTNVNAGTLIVNDLTASPNVFVGTGATLIAHSIVADTLTIGGGQVVAVPEPATWIMLVLAGFAMLASKKRCR